MVLNVFLKKIKIFTNKQREKSMTNTWRGKTIWNLPGTHLNSWNLGEWEEVIWNTARMLDTFPPTHRWVNVSRTVTAFAGPRNCLILFSTRQSASEPDIGWAKICSLPTFSLNLYKQIYPLLSMYSFYILVITSSYHLTHFLLHLSLKV